jgi:hypothetical protein
MTTLYAAVMGQETAVAQLEAAARAPVHAYMLVGPPGAGGRELARSFAAALLCPNRGCGTCIDCRRVLGGSHPDVVVRERSGPYITVDDAREIGQLASTTPMGGRRKVLVLVDFHLVQEAAPALLKILEEPPPTTVFVVLADHVPPELVTIASRCVRVDLSPVPAQRIAELLVGRGLEPSTARQVAESSGGRVDRALLLASDAGFAARQAAWREVPTRLGPDARGATVAAVADDLLERETGQGADGAHGASPARRADRQPQGAGRPSPQGAAQGAPGRAAMGAGHPGRCLPRQAHEWRRASALAGGPGRRHGRPPGAATKPERDTAAAVPPGTAFPPAILDDPARVAQPAERRTRNA